MEPQPRPIHRLLGHARAWARIAALVALTTPVYLGFVLSRALGWISPAAGGWTHRIFIVTWGKVAVRILGIRLRVEGPRPESPFFLVSNHLSYVDIPVFLAALDVRFLAKSEVAGWPLFGYLARTSGTLFVDRTRKRDLKRVIGEIRRVLASGTGVLVFPEATSTKGAEVLPFKASIFQVPAEMELPVSCAAIRYETPPGAPPAWQVCCWWGDASFGAHFYRFLQQGRTDANVVFAPDRLVGRDRKVLARLAHEALERRFVPTYEPPRATESDDPPPRDTAQPETPQDAAARDRAPSGLLARPSDDPARRTRR